MSATDGLPYSVLRGHDRSIAALSVFDGLLFSAYMRVMLPLSVAHCPFSDDAGRVCVWSLRRLELVGELSLGLVAIAALEAVAVGSDATLVFIQLKCGRVAVYDYHDGCFSRNTEFASGTYTFCRMGLVRPPGQETVFFAHPSAETENGITVMEWPSQRCILSGHLPASVDNAGMCLFVKLYWRRERHLVMMCGYETGVLSITAIDPVTGARNLVLETRVLDESCTCADLHLDDGSVVAVGAGSTLKILRGVWTQGCVSETATELLHPGCSSVAIRDDGRLFVTGGWDAKIRYFSLKSGKPLAVLEHHYDTVTVVVCTRIEGKHCTLAGSADGTISLWMLYQ